MMFFFGYISYRTTQSAAVAGNQLTFSQIEEMINKYTSELEEQEKVFINQATQVNSWDNLLNKNSKKVLNKWQCFIVKNIKCYFFLIFLDC